MYRLVLIVLMVGSPAAVFAACYDPYPPSLVNGFERDCARAPGRNAFCGCVIARIQKTIALSDFIETGSKPDGLNNDPRVIKATGECSILYPSLPK